MKNYHLFKPFITTTLIFMALQISACSSDKSTELSTTDITDPETNATSDTDSTAVIISGTDKGSVIEDIDPDADNLLEISGKLDITDNGTGEAAFFATTISGNYGSLTIDADGYWFYNAENDQPTIQQLDAGNTLNDSLTVSSLDGTVHTIVITIFGTNEINMAAEIIVSWIAPSERENNVPITLSEIAGYKIYYGSSQGQYPNSISINNSNIMSYTFTDFSTGSYFFVLTTIDTYGLESGFSSEVKKTI